MFEEFIKPSEAQWRAVLEKELKGASLDSKNWTIESTLTAKPFHFPQSVAQANPLVRYSADWEICEDVAASGEAKTANTAALLALEGGAEGLCFQMENVAESSFFQTLLQGVFVDYIGLGFSGKGLQENPGAVLASLLAVCEQNNMESVALKGRLSYQPSDSALRPDWRYASDLVDFAKSEFPALQLFELKAKKSFLTEPIAELTALFKEADVHFEGLAKAGQKVKDIADNTTFCLEIGTSYFVEIAKLRAFQIVYLHFLKAWQLPPQNAKLTVRFNPAVFTKAIYSNMIRSTTMAMSAVIGGTDRLIVLPHDAGFETDNAYGAAFSKRIARNVQHLLKSESYLNLVIDPAAGSYYIEDLTNQIAEGVWKNLA